MASTFDHNAVPLAHQGRAKSDAARNLGLVPLLVAIPLMYWPKVIEGDTQPWVSLGAAVALIAYWPVRAGYQFFEATMVVALCAAAIVVFYLAGADEAGILRYGVILTTFAMLWIIGLRNPGALIGQATRWTV